MRCSLDSEPTTRVRSAILHAQRVEQRSVVEEQTLHGRVVDEEKRSRSLHARRPQANRPRPGSRPRASRGSSGEAGGSRADHIAEPVAVKAPAALLGEEEDEAWDTAGEPDAVDDARVSGVGDDHLIPGSTVQRRTLRSASSPRGDDDLALRVVAMAAPFG